MEAALSGNESGDSPFDGLRAEATAAVGHSANALRIIRDQYREAYNDLLVRWQALRDQQDTSERTTRGRHDATGRSDAERAAVAAEVGAADALERGLRMGVVTMTSELGDRQAELGRLDLAQGTLERTWLFLERGDATLVSDASEGPTDDELAMRIVEAQEAERSRLAQEIHDGPAQALSNAIFQVDYLERIIGPDAGLATMELTLLRERLRRDLDAIRVFISRLRPPVLDDLGLDGAIGETVEHIRALTGITITTEFKAPDERLSDNAKTSALRVAQEALQNVRKHASASHATVKTWLDDGTWTLEIADDGRGFEIGAVAARGRRNFGLQFMRERAELIGARFDVRSLPDGGTVVRLAIPTDAVSGEKESR